MEKTSTAPTVPDPDPGSDSERLHARGGRTALDWAGLVLLAAGVLVLGAFAGLFGPLLAVACDSCQDGIRGPLRFDAALVAVAWIAVPLTTLGTVIGTFLPRGGARVGGIGVAVLVALLLVMQALGQFTA
ncbi:hypothetical protein [Streptomyces iconiensis]|uniref:Integral membrane protein n=1 Tax=Streptomyces iconiensis TaxID=1384038 RepID=A0ABT7A5J7_9ACTN|nr:hypothetical protein [Streptomyces iconiensis]MDJ1136623.1 hypothetical protein [Streptomyces iconiensis]